MLGTMVQPFSVPVSVMSPVTLRLAEIVWSAVKLFAVEVETNALLARPLSVAGC